MAIDAINTALSGLFASSRSLAVSANNVPNAQTTQTTDGKGNTVNAPYVPKQVNNTSVQNGGVTTSLSDISPASVSFFAPDNLAADENGMTAFPNVNLEQETANQLLAANTYKANASIIKRENEVFKSLLDITG